MHEITNFYREVINNIEGWITDSEGLFLYESAKNVKPENVIVEIGSWKGKSTTWLGAGSQNGNRAKVYAVDLHTGTYKHHVMSEINTFEKFKQNITKAGVSEFIKPIIDSSENAAGNFTQPIEFIFIDAAHEYEAVNLDFKVWFPKVINGGILAFHDSWRFLGPSLFTFLQLLFSSRVRNPRLIDTITCFEKVERNSFLDRIRNISFVIYRGMFGVIGFLKLEYSKHKMQATLQSQNLY